MMELEGNQPDLTRKGFRQKTVVFLVTGFSLLGLLTLGWSALIKGYQVRSNISIHLAEQASEAQIQALVANAYRSVSADSQLKEILTRLRQQIPLRSPVLSGDSEELRNSLWAETVPASEPNLMHIQVVLQGNGSKEDRAFLSHVTDALKMEIEKITPGSALSGQLVVGDLKMAKFRHRLREIQSSAAALENNYEAICRHMEGRQTAGNQQPFRSASHKVPTADIAESDLTKLLASTQGTRIEKDIQSLIEESWASPWSKQDSALPEFSIVPIGGPDFKNFLVLIVLAGAGGLVTAVNYQPFAYRGFASITAVSQRLKIPVVATLPINQYNGIETVSNRSIDRKIPWANRLADAASIFFAASLILTIGFCIFSEEIRHAFFRNPFEGFTRILWFLMGH